MTLPRSNYEQIYLSSLRFEPQYGPLSDKYDVKVRDLALHRQEQRSWAVVRFAVASMPGCVFARAGSVWPGSPDRDPEWEAQLFSTYLVEILDARGWGLPSECSSERTTWLHRYGRAPWEPRPEEEPERQAWEQRFQMRMTSLLDAAPPVVPVERFELRDHYGETKALVTVRDATRPSCTFANGYPVWVGWPTPLTAEQRAVEFHDRVVGWTTRLPEPCEPDGLTWGGPAPLWFAHSAVR